MTIELLPCPFCGGNADFAVIGTTYPFRVKCDDCGAIVGGSSFPNDSFNAEQWNKRTRPEPPK